MKGEIAEMSIADLTFTKEWTDPSDFPTLEPNETQVRADMQYLFDEIRDFINAYLVAAFNDMASRVEAIEDLSVPENSITYDKLCKYTNVEAVVTEAVRAEAITTAKLDHTPNFEAVAREVIRNGAINAAKLDSGCVTPEKLSGILPEHVGILYGTATEEEIAELLSDGQIYLKLAE